MRTENQQLATKLAECVQVCNHCFNACLAEDDVKMMTECIKLDRECALICATTLNMVYEESHFVREILSLCKEACRQCAEECQKHPMDHCQECARVCRECAMTCSEFLNNNIDNGTC